jgi:hypothetical protein
MGKSRQMPLGRNPKKSPVIPGKKGYGCFSMMILCHKTGSLSTFLNKIV